MYAELQQAQDFILQSRHDPQYWNKVTFGTREQPWSKQWDIWNSVKDFRRTVVKAGRGIGKSFIAARIVIWFLFCYPGAMVITTAPTARQVEEILWKEIRTQYKLTKYDLGGKLYDGTSQLKIDDDWKAIGFTTQKGQKDVSHTPMSGFHAEYVLIVIDEAADSGIDHIFDAAENIATSHYSRILAIGNPIDPTSEFAKCFEAPPGNQLGGWNKISISVLDSPNVKAGKIIYPRMTTLEWVESCKRKWGEASPMYR
ncbi:MAG: DEAD/DEAH box helicase family protein, partial [Candidatus Thorarchaeota archaeon]